ncbi:MAG: WD40 repeat domain-containing protein [Anaerolineales bacterium]|nr:WD40 repeat domain-containing protein [Anaerolineales bacterium]
MALHPSGRELVTGYSDGSVQRWSLARADAPVAIGAPFAAHPAPIDGLAYRGDGAVLVTTGGPGDRFALWDLRDTAAPALLSEPDFEGKGDLWIERAVFSPNGEHLALTRGETVMVWAVTRPEAPRLLGEWTVPDSVVYDLAYSLNGGTLVVARADGTLTSLGFGLTGGLEVMAAQADAEGPTYAVAYQPTGASLATVNTDGQLTLWRVGDPEAAPGRSMPGLAAMPDFVRYSPDGQLLAVEQVGQVALFDLRLSADPVQASEPLSMGSLIMDAAFAPDGTWLAAAEYAGDIALWDVRDSRAPKPLTQPVTGHTISIWSLAISPDGRLLATGDYDGVVRLWDVRDPSAPQLLSEPTSTNNGVHTLVFSADSRRLLAASWDRQVHVWSVEDPAAPTLWGEPFGDQIQSLAYDPDRNLVITGDHDGRLAIWDLNGPSGAISVGGPMPALSDAISDAVYLPASGVLAVGDEVLGAVQLWDLADLQRPIPYASLPLPDSSFRGFSARPDGAVLALWGFDLPLTMVDVGPDALVARACQLAGRNLSLVEWRRYLGALPYQVTCAVWPSGETDVR